MPLLLLHPPTAEPLSLGHAKHFLRVEHGDDDELVAALIAGARGHVEARTRRALMTQTWRLILDAWPAEGLIPLLLAPLRSVVAARLHRRDGTTQAVDAEAFTVDAAAAPGVVGFAPGAVPAPGRALAGIEIDIEAGYGPAPEDVPEPLRQAMRLLIVHWYENRSAVSSREAAAPMPMAVEALIAPYRVMAL